MRRNYLRRLRIAAGMTVYDVGRELGYWYGSYANIERGDRLPDLKVSMIRKLADLYHRPPAEILQLEIEYQDSLDGPDA